MVTTKKRKTAVASAKIDSYFSKVNDVTKKKKFGIDENEEIQLSKESIRKPLGLKNPIDITGLKNEFLLKNEKCLENHSYDDNKTSMVSTKKPLGLKDNGDNVGLKARQPLAETTESNTFLKINAVKIPERTFNVLSDEDISKGVQQASDVQQKPSKVSKDDIDTQNVTEFIGSQCTDSSPIEYIDSQTSNSILQPDEQESIDAQQWKAIPNRRTDENRNSQEESTTELKRNVPRGILTSRDLEDEEKGLKRPFMLYSNETPSTQNRENHLLIRQTYSEVKNDRPFKVFCDEKNDTLASSLSDEDRFFDNDDNDTIGNDLFSEEEDEFSYELPVPNTTSVPLEDTPKENI